MYNIIKKINANIHRLYIVFIRIIKELLFFIDIHPCRHWYLNYEFIRVTVKNKKIDFKDYACYRNRFYSTKELTLAAFKHRKFFLANYRFWIYTGDKFNYNFLLKYKKKNFYYFTKDKNPYPCFSFWGWIGAKLDFERDTKILAKVGLKKPKIQKAFWIGNVETSPKRADLLKIGKKRSDILDIQDHKFSEDDKKKKNFIPLIDHYRWSILIDIEGQGYSGRLKYLLYSRRPLLIIENNWKEFWQHGLKPMVHYIPVKSDLSDLVEKTEMLLNDANLQKEIAKNALNYARKNITRETAYKQIESVFKHAKEQSNWLNKILSRF